MESLAVLAAVILLCIVTFGVVALVIAFRSPEKTWARVVATVAVTPAVIGGGWLALLDVGQGARVIGAIVLCAGVMAIARTWRGR